MEDSVGPQVSLSATPTMAQSSNRSVQFQFFLTRQLPLFIFVF